jgi:hypothetical protein
MLTLIMPKNAVTISIITTVLVLLAETKRHGGPNSQKKSVRCNRIAMQLMISGNTVCRNQGEPPARRVFRWQHSEDFGDRSQHLPPSALPQARPILD